MAISIVLFNENITGDINETNLQRLVMLLPLLNALLNTLLAADDGSGHEACLIDRVYMLLQPNINNRYFTCNEQCFNLLSYNRTFDNAIYNSNKKHNKSSIAVALM